MRFKKAIAFTVSALLTFMNMSNIVMAEEQQPITDGVQKINANNLGWTPVSRTNQLGGADDFSGIFFNELKDFNETGGPIAAGSLNNVKIVTFDAGYSGGINQFDDIVIPKFNVGVMAQKNVNIGGKTLISNGDAVIGDSVDPQKLDPKVGNIYKRQNEIDKFLGDAKADLVKLNKDLWNTEETAKAIYDSNTVILNCVKGINIFEVDLTSGRKSIIFNYAEDAKDSTIIIKYKGNVINYAETFIGSTMLDKLNVDEISNRVIWTFDPSLKEVKIDRTIVFGSILAPNADITFSSAGYSAINGTVIANRLDGSGSSSELHWVGPFKGDIITPIEKTGSFEFNKKDNHGNAISGATFGLFQGDDAKYTATSTNKVSFNGIEPGDYILKEISPPNGYEISKLEVDVIVSNNGTVTFKENGVIKTEGDLDLLYVNNISKVSFNFNKVVAGTDTRIPNVEFKLMQEDKEIAKAKSNASGVVTFNEIELGTYTLVEITPTGYKAAGPWVIEVTENGAIIDGEIITKIDNVENTGYFEFDKLDNHDKAVNGAEFALYQEEEVKYTATSTKDGLVSFNDIKQGTYIMKETSSPDGYEISNAVVEVKVSSDGTVTFKVNGEDKELADLDKLYVNNVSTVDFSFNKVIAKTDTGIPSVEFKLMQGDKEIATEVSDEKGVVTFNEIELGTYTLVETRPFGYESAGPWTVSITKEGAFIGENKLDKIENVEVMAGFEFNKLDNHEKAVNGATFALYQDGVEKYTVTSTESGLVSFSDIKEGTYTLKETSAPDGYEISNATVEVTVDSNGYLTFKVDEEDKELGDLYKLYVNNITTVEFDFNKVISGTKTGIPEVEFKLMQGDNVVATEVSDENGTVSFSNIEVGSYRLVETTPDGYKAAGPWDIEVTKNGATIDGKALTEIENVQVIGSFKFNKLDNHNKLVKGAEFALYQDGEVKYTSTSTGNLSLESILLSYQLILRSSDEISIGEVSFSGIKQGTYILKETKAPDGYEISNVEVEVTVNSDGTVTFKVNGEDKELADLDKLYVNNVSTVDFSFNKVIAKTDTGIPDVEFKLLQGDKEIATEVSNENDVVSFENVELGTYTLVETRPFGYESAGPWTVNVTKEGAFIGENKLVQIENIEVIGNFQFNKLDNHEKAVNGATFGLYQDGVEKYTSTSTDKGLVSFNDVKEGTYTLKETSAPDGYEISDAIVEVTVDKDGSVTFKVDGKDQALEDLNGIFINNVSTVDFSFNKVIAKADTGIPDVEFKLLQGDKEIATAISDENGVVSFENIELGTYTLVETRPFGYESAGPWTVNITKEGAFIGETKLDKIENIEVIGNFQFNKLDNHEKAVNGATFGLYQGEELKYTSTSTDKGLVSFSDVKEGTYTLKETSAPDGYEISDAIVEVTVDSHGTITFKVDGENKELADLDVLYVNNVSTVNFRFNKVIAKTDTGIPGVEFKLMQGDKEIATANSDKNGVVSFENIELGTYTLVETRPFGYESAGSWTVNVTKEGAFIGETKLDKIENIEVMARFEFNKLDNHEKAVNGAIFGLYQDGVEKYTSTSTDKGLVSFSDVKEGTYTLKETSAPNGYEISDAVVEVTVSSDGYVSFKVNGEDKELADLDKLYVNNVSTVEFNFNKVIAKTDTGIPNVEFKLMQGDKEIATATSNEDGVVTFNAIELGSYTLVETRPFGYEVAGPWTVNVTKEGAFIEDEKLVQIENVVVIAGFEFNKLDNHGKAVNGAEFALYQDGVEKYTSTSTDAGLVSFNDIKEGTYILKEISAPDGYEISDTIVEVTVDSHGTITFKVDGENKELADLDVLYVNNVSTVNFRFNKVIAKTDTGIPNVEFKLMQGDKEIATATSNEDGVVTFNAIELGSYTLVETRPFGYEVAGPWTVNVTKEGAFIEDEKLVQIENVVVIAGFEFNKLDNHGKAVNGAEFALYQDGVEKYTSTSTDAGLVSFSDVKEGTYTLKETSAPDGYEISDAEVIVIVDKDGKVTFSLEGEEEALTDLNGIFVNNISKTEFSFNKVVSGTKTGIPNVEFKLLQGDKEIATATSDKNGVVSFENIELGSYTLVETTPAGYKAAGPWNIEVTKEGAAIDGVILTEIENEKIIEKTGSFQFNKKDNHGNAVNGATFALYQDGELKYTVNSTDTGVVSFNDLKEGTYTLKEIRCPCWI